MKRIVWYIGIFLLANSCESKVDKIIISDIVKPDRYYDSEIFQERNIELYGKWKALYSYGGIGGTYLEPGFDYLEIVKYGIYGIMSNNDVKEIGKIEINLQEDNETVISFIKDDEYSSNYYLQYKLVLFNGNDTLLLAAYNMDDGFTAYFKRIK